VRRPGRRERQEIGVEGHKDSLLSCREVQLVRVGLECPQKMYQAQ
jgi:hypothetical protein